MRTLLLLLALATAAFAQLDTNVITVTASRTATAPPDQVAVAVTVTTGEKQTLDTVLASLPSGITATELAGVTGYGSGHVQWTFNLTVAIKDLTSTIAGLNAAAAHGGFPIGFYVQGSTTAATPQCPYPALISDARAQAAKLATAAGVTLGPIVTLEQGTQTAASGYQFVSGVLYGIVSVVDQLTSLLTTPRFYYPTPTCTLTVQFKIG